MYQPSGIATSLEESSHSVDPCVLIQTLNRAFGPIRIGEASGTKTVLFPAVPHPLRDAVASAAKSIRIRSSIRAHWALRDALVEPRDERDGDLCDDALEHVTSSPSCG